MRILLVEDDKDYISQITKDLATIHGYAKVTVAESKTSAIELLEKDFFDLIVLDLKIPTVDGAVDTEPEHGYAVFEFARQLAPGTPIFVLTGSPAEPFIVQLLTGNIHQADIWGSGSMPTVQFLPKHRYGLQFEEMITPYLKGFSSIFEVELKEKSEKVTTQDDRIVRIFATQHRAAKCVVHLLSGGLSGAKVFRLKLTNSQGAPIHDAVAKIGPKAEVFDESERFDKHVCRLEGKATPRKLGLVNYGAGNVCGVFYGLASGYESDAFEAAMRNDSTAETVITELRSLTARWRDGVPETRHQIRTIRQRAISDDQFNLIRASINHRWVEDFEDKAVQTVYSCSHGDMHGLNVLATKDGHPILIDYGDVGDAAAPWDPITLELSLLFHPKGPLRTSSWPSDEQAAQWGNIDSYLKNCPTPNFILACRDWAHKSAAGNREIAAAAYSYLVRQLKYEENNQVRINALLTGVKALFDMS